MQPKISIIIPAYNAERFLPAAIDSVLGQTHKNWELIIVDDGSKDSTPTIINLFVSRDSRIRSVRQPNGGLAAARNTGTKNSDPDAPYIIFLDSDDVWEPYALTKLAALLEDNPASPCAHGLPTIIDAKGKPSVFPSIETSCRLRRFFNGRAIEPANVTEKTTFAHLIIANCIATPGAALLRRSHLNEIGKFEVYFNPAEDWDLFVRLSRKADFEFLPEPVIRYRLHDSNMSNSQPNMYIAYRKVKLAASRSQDNSPQQRRTAFEAIRCEMNTWRKEKIGYLMADLAAGKPRGALRQVKPIISTGIKAILGVP